MKFLSLTLIALAIAATVSAAADYSAATHLAANPAIALGGAIAAVHVLIAAFAYRGATR